MPAWPADLIQRLEAEANALNTSNGPSGAIVAMRDAARTLRQQDAVIRDHVDRTSRLLADLLTATVGGHR
jgi:hypothetical protein